MHSRPGDLVLGMPIAFDCQTHLCLLPQPFWEASVTLGVVNTKNKIKRTELNWSGFASPLLYRQFFFFGGGGGGGGGGDGGKYELFSRRP